MKTIPATWSRLFRRLHRDERGSVSLETILVLGAVAVPILIFLLKFGWPRLKDYFNKGMENLESESDAVISNT